MKKIFYVTFIIISFFISSCEIINPEEEIPSFVKIDSIAFSTTPEQGTNRQQLLDAWVFIDGEKIGTFEMPCTVPILKSGNVKIEILPGIKLNGISNTRAIYQMVKPWKASINLKKDSVLFLKPSSEYSEAAVIENPVESFEDAGISISATSFSDTSMLRTSTPEEVFEGNFSGMIVVDKQRSMADLKSNSSYDLPTGIPAFLEIHFKTDAPVSIGLTANKGATITYQPIVRLNETTSWKKMYVNLTPTVSDNNNAENFNYFIRLKLPEGRTEARCFIDNIKLIHGK